MSPPIRRHPVGDAERMASVPASHVPKARLSMTFGDGSPGVQRMNKTDTSPSNPSLRYASILLAFTLSGCAGLIFQSIWAQYLGLFLGHAAYAQSIVLAIYMGGMAIGAQWVGLRSYRWQNLLRAYAI